MERRNLIYHVPYELQYVNPGGGMVRPVKMLRAFENLGKVWLVSGNAAARRRAMKNILAAIDQGVHFEMCYSESSTMPTTLTEPHHLPTHPLLDFRFFSRLRKHGIPVGLFYRDIEWRFPMYKQLVPWHKAYPALAMYRYDLFAYGRTLDHLFLPSDEMAEWVKLPKHVPISALPPGHDVNELPSAPQPHPLRLFYVGGFRNKYRLHEVLAAVHDLPKVELTVCTRADEWEKARGEYQSWLGSNVRVIHESGEGLVSYYRQSNLAIVAAEPQEYWRFAAPLKLFEYIGNALPVLASKGTLAGRLVEQWRIGWTVAYQREAIRETLQELHHNPQLLTDKRNEAVRVRDEHTWLSRAAQVLGTLSPASI